MPFGGSGKMGFECQELRLGIGYMVYWRYLSSGAPSDIPPEYLEARDALQIDH